MSTNETLLYCNCNVNLPEYMKHLLSNKQTEQGFRY